MAGNITKKRNIKSIRRNFFTRQLDDNTEKETSLKLNQAAILNSKTPFLITEAYKTTRTNIIFSVAGTTSEKGKTILLTSANPGEGKTTTVINLAITFSQTGAKVLLIDGDLRKPRVHQYLGIVKTNGLSTVLSLQKSFDEVVFHDIRPSLDVLTSGSIPPNPAELLASESMQKLLEDLKSQYDYIFFDTPPATVVTDSVALSKFTDGTIIVVREGFTDHESIAHSINLFNIAGTKIIGFFVNDVSSANSSYGSYQKRYGKKYGYGKRYGYKYGGGYRYGGYGGYGGYGYGYGYSYGDRKRRGGYSYGYSYGDTDKDASYGEPAEMPSKKGAVPLKKDNAQPANKPESKKEK